MAVTLDGAVGAMDAEYLVLEDIAAALGNDDLAQPSGCRKWTVADLLFHMLLDAQRALVTFASPAPGPATRDYVSYWRGFSSADEDARAHAEFVRASVRAFRDPGRVVARWRETAAAARRVAPSVGHRFVTTQGHVLATADFVTTLVVEATLHHLDLCAHLDGNEDPPPGAVALTVETLDGLMPVPRPPGWDDLTYLSKATGRSDLTHDDRACLGAAAEALPLFS